jgi:hypothetical protein
VKPAPEQLKLPDPYFGNVELPLTASYYPAGFPLELSTNSHEVLESANESWGRWSQEFELPALKIRVVVQSKGALAPPPVVRWQGRLFCIISDGDNVALGDLRSLEGSIFVSEQTAVDHAWLRWYFLEALAYVLLEQRYAVPVHAACVAQGDSGVLLCGPSGAGKSTLSFACARAGATFVSDDATWLLPEGMDSVAIGRPHQARFRPDAPKLFPELEKFAERVRPNGKLSLEIRLEEFPEIRTASNCRIGNLVLLDRVCGSPASLEEIEPARVIGGLLPEAASWGEDVDRLQHKTVRKLLSLPAYRLRYDGISEAVDLLSRLKS